MVEARLAREEDLEQIRAVERAAGRLFAEIGMQAVADDEPMPLDELLKYQRAGQILVAFDHHDAPVGYLLFRLIGGCAHIEQLSVHPDYQRRGIGRSLLNQVAAWSTGNDIGSLTLTTFRHVAWNPPTTKGVAFASWRRMN